MDGYDPMLNITFAKLYNKIVVAIEYEGKCETAEIVI
jgi:hypothetical protein